uniref:Putative LAGLIDADG endonuclease n=1 Tax=Cyberlindnera suaveolens TaxID=907738 RepID=S5U4Z0_9ASCO|nr:putative LAGLIDADG endonuclease [Cyberlindnera suaveolens]AGS44433.1 putative LAGLIDADG endonuclease [Cyberlindnera suaveolens]
MKKSNSISKSEIENILNNINHERFKINENQLGYYLAGLLEGDGNINIPSLGKTILLTATGNKRILNPRITFTGDKKNLELFVFLYDKLGKIGRFSKKGNIIRYIIGDIDSTIKIIELLHGKLRTPKNKTFNHLIKYYNNKLNLNILLSPLDNSSFEDNAWFAGIIEADGHFGVKVTDFKPKTDKTKRSRSASVTLRFILQQRAFDQPTQTDFYPIMTDLSKFLDCNLNHIKSSNMLSLEVSAINKLTKIINYFNNYPLIGVKYLDFKDWETIYYLIIANNHTDKNTREYIKELKSNMNNSRKL